MIWLINEELLTLNNIKSQNKNVTKELLRDLLNKESYQLYDAEKIDSMKSEDNLYIDDKYIEYHLIGKKKEKTNISSKWVYIKKVYKSLYPMSLMVLQNIDSEVPIYLGNLIDFDGIELDAVKYFIDVEKTSKRDYIFKKCNIDLYYFVNNILDNIYFEKVSEYNTMALRAMKESQEIVNAKNHLEEADYNSRVLKLARELR